MQIEKRLVEQIEVTGSYDDFMRVLKFLQSEGYHTTRSGPKPSDKEPHTYDMTQYLIRAERDADEIVRWAIDVCNMYPDITLPESMRLEAA